MGFFPALHAEVALFGNAFLEREYSHGADASYLRTLMRQANFFGRMEGVLGMEERILVRIRKKKFRMLRGEKEIFLEIPGSSSEWESDDLLRGKIIFLFLCRRFLAAPEYLSRALAVEEIPFWLTAAMDKALAAACREGLYLRSNRDLFALRTLRRELGALPDFGILTMARRELIGTSEKKYFEEESLLLAEIFCRRKMMKDYLFALLSGRSAGDWLAAFPSPEEAQKIMTREASALLWNRAAPCPAVLLEKELPSLENMLVPMKDEKGNPEWKMLPIAEAAPLMSAKNPETPHLQRELEQRCRAFAAQSSLEVSRSTRLLAEAAAKLNEDTATLTAYLDQLRNLRELLKKEKEKEAFLEREANKALPVIPAWQGRFRALDSPSSAMSENVEKFLRETEESYLSDY